MRGRLLKLTLLVGAFALVVAACGDDDDVTPTTATPPAATDAPPPMTEAEPVELRTVTLAEGLNPFHLQALAAQEAGFFAKRGLTLDVIYVQGGGSAQHAALFAGEAQFIAQVAASVAAGVQGGQPLRFACAISNQLDRRFEVRSEIAGDIPNAAEAGFEATVQALKGKVFGVVAIGSGNQQDAIGILAQAGIDEDEVVWVAVGGPATAMAALQAGEVDVVPAYGGLIQQVESQGVAVPVLDYARDVPAFETFFNAGWATTLDLAEDDPEFVQAFCEAITEASDWIREPANRQTVIDLLVGALGYDETLAAEFPDGYFAEMLEGCLDITALETALDVAVTQGLLEQSMAPADLLAPGAVVCG